MAKKAVNISVRPRGPRDSGHMMIKRFLRKCKKERIIEQYRDTLYYEKPSTKRAKAKRRRARVLQKLREKERNS
tara:strand:- start:5126 stop:5347 length:222 start_codon:yes stop_codon:yes gene_type:complete